MVRSARSARLEPWAACSALAAARLSRAGFAGRLRTRMRGIADLMVRSAAKPRVSNHGRLRASMAGFPVNNRESTVALPPWRLLRGGALLQMKRAARGGPCGCFHLRRDGAGMALHANARRGGRRAQFQMWIFSYNRFGATVKKWVSRVMLSAVPAPILGVHRAFASNASSLTRGPATWRGGSRTGLPSSPEALQNQRRRANSYVLTAIASGPSRGSGSRPISRMTALR